jgi:hypothetical protein
MSDLCVTCGKIKDKFSLDLDYQDCEPCSIVQSINDWDLWEKESKVHTNA